MFLFNPVPLGLKEILCQTSHELQFLKDWKPRRLWLSVLVILRRISRELQLLQDWKFWCHLNNSYSLHLSVLYYLKINFLKNAFSTASVILCRYNLKPISSWCSIKFQKQYIFLPNLLIGCTVYTTHLYIHNGTLKHLL